MEQHMPTETPPNLLFLCVKKAGQLLDSLMVEEQDPYVSIWVGFGWENPHKVKTKVSKDGGSTPTWNEYFMFNIEGIDLNECMAIELKSKNITGTNSIGIGKIRLSSFSNIPKDEWYSLYDPNGQPVGKVNIEGCVAWEKLNDKGVKEVEKSESSVSANTVPVEEAKASTNTEPVANVKVSTNTEEVKGVETAAVGESTGSSPVQAGFTAQQQYPTVGVGVPHPAVFMPPMIQHGGLYPGYGVVMPNTYGAVMPGIGGYGMVPPMYGYPMNPLMGGYFGMNPVMGGYPMIRMDSDAPGFIAPPGSQDLRESITKFWGHPIRKRDIVKNML
ncbi:unnamed protein product [Choristocarpus tenellus]